MRCLCVAALAFAAAASFTGGVRAESQVLPTCPTPSSDTGSAIDEDEDVGSGGPGAGGDGRGELGPTPDMQACGAGLTGNVRPSRAVAAWFNALKAGDRRKFMLEARKVGVVDHNGRPFALGDFKPMMQGFDEAMTRRGMTDADKLKLLSMMAEDAGITNEAETRHADGR